MFERLRKTVREVLEAAEEISVEAGVGEVGGVAILRELLPRIDEEGVLFLERLGTRAEEISRHLPSALRDSQIDMGPGAVPGGGGAAAVNRGVRFDLVAKRILTFAYEEADRCGDKGVGTSELIVALLRSGGGAGRALERVGMTLQKARDVLDGFRTGEEFAMREVKMLEAKLEAVVQRMEVRCQRIEEAHERLTQKLPDLLITLMVEQGMMSGVSEATRLNLRARMMREIKRLLRVS